MPPASFLKTNSVLFVERLSARADMDGSGSTTDTGAAAGTAATGTAGVALGEEGEAAGGTSGL